MAQVWDGKQPTYSDAGAKSKTGTLRDMIRSPAWACVGDVPYSFLTRTTPSTAAPRLPAVPCRHVPGEAPVGFSVAGMRGTDAHVLGVAQAIEAVLNK